MPKSITRDELIAQLASPEPPTLIEALGAAYFADAHLPGAVNLPAGLVDDLVGEVLRDRPARIVVYCSGSCASSRIVAERLERLGYADVAVYEGGKADWVQHGLPVERTETSG